MLFVKAISSGDPDVRTNLASTGAPKNCQSHIKNVINVFVNQVWFFGGMFNILSPLSLYLLNTNIVMNIILLWSTQYMSAMQSVKKMEFTEILNLMLLVYILLISFSVKSMYSLFINDIYIFIITFDFSVVYG